MTARGARLLTVLPAALALSCSAEPPAPAADATPAVIRTQRDGYEHVLSRRPAWDDATRWRLAAEPRVVIGVAEGEQAEMFAHARRGVLLPDGTVVVADGSNEIRYFDGTGTFLHAAGRLGSGPCEFESMIGEAWRGAAGAVVVDDVTGRLSLFAPDGGCLASTRQIAAPDHLGATVAGQLDDGDIVAFAAKRPDRGGSGEIDGAPWQLATLFRIDPLDGSLTELAVVRAREGPWGESVEFASRGSVAADGDCIYVTSGERYSIDVLDRDGAKLMQIERAGEPPEVTAEDIDAWRDKALANLRSAGSPERSMQRFEQTQFAPRFPAYVKLSVDATGNLWAMQDIGLAGALPFVVTFDSWQRFPSPDSIAWDVFGPDGVWLGSVEIAMPMVFNDATGDTVLLMAIDDEGIERFYVHDLIKP